VTSFQIEYMPGTDTIISIIILPFGIVEREFYCLETNFVLKLYCSMPDRVNAVLESNGWYYTKY